MRSHPPFDPDGNLWDHIAFELRRHRHERNLSLAEVGQIIDRDRSLVARVESGDTKMQGAHAIHLDTAWNTGGRFQRLVNFAKAGHEVEWFQTHLEHEATASHLRIWELGWMPGLFQTEAYARAIFEGCGVEDVEEGVRARLSRQTCLDRHPRPRIWVILDQGILDQPVGGREIMHAQLAHLVELARQPNFRVRIVPTEVGSHVGRDGSFKIMTVNGADVVYTDAQGGGRLVQDAAEISSYRVWFDLIGDVALPKDASLRLLEDTMERYS
ncbi:helix-turn-helix transcriptional regulator [Actinomadura sp. 7K507]|uniref:helix-turn-helix domain-containing protein n=1 Tax=Actinomadura sp. 7K507 TaxID=2530365 RepID=UPI00104D1E0F|nr:helix-turn-helix transcriptional regulator [Actinomadura sp. 7K507]TDC79428.1 XRE family transcriptional regulator [Actinomadura sp. 7K507]